MAKNNRIAVPPSHGRDAEKMKKQLEDLLSNLRLVSHEVDTFKKLLNKPTEKAFKINED